MIEGQEVSASDEKIPRITFADVPLGIIRDISRISGYSRVIPVQEFLDLGVHEEVFSHLVKDCEVPIFVGQKDSPLVARKGVRGWDLNQQIAKDLGIVEDPEVVFMDNMNRSAGLQEQIFSYASAESINNRNNYSLPTMYVENCQIDLPQIRGTDEDSGGALVGITDKLL